MRLRAVGTSFTCMLIALITAGWAYAAPPPAGFSAEVGKGSIDVGALQSAPDQPSVARGPSVAGDRGVGPVYVYAVVPACVGSTPGGGTVDSLCATARVGCPGGLVRYWSYRSVDVQPRVWERTGATCLALGAPGTDGEEFVVGFTVEDFRRLPLPPAGSVVQPPGGRVLINVETNVYATADQVLVPTEVLDQPVTVRATPVAYAWDFGDGGTVGPTGDPGAPWPVLRNAHVYAVPGEYAITLTTTYAGEFSVAGGPFLPIDGTAEVASLAQPVTAVAARTELVAAPLP